jgi:heavy metal translocating P-type ATPase
MMKRIGAKRMLIGPLAAAAWLIAGLMLSWLGDQPESAARLWTVGLWLLGIPLVFRTLRGVLRGRLAADLVAGLAIVTSMALGHAFAGLVIVLMQTGGEALEHFAERRASAAVRALEADTPRVAHRLDAGLITDVASETIQAGERILVRPGEMIPCDGRVESGTSLLDVARLTGEPYPVRVSEGDPIRSGSLVIDGALVLSVTAIASESLYTRIVELVRTAQTSKAPLQRVADRYAVWFTPLTVLVALLAYALSGDPERALAVLVVATPCPLILATPVAIIGGINRSARRQIIVRHGGALEALATVDTAVFDKTGTLTVGRPDVTRVRGVAPFTKDDVLRLAGAVEQGSGHRLAQTLVAAARARVGELPTVSNVSEVAGRGVTGSVEGRSVTVGAFSLIRERWPAAARMLEAHHEAGPALRAFVAVDGLPAGSVTYADRVRDEVPEVISALRSLGINRIALLSGDRSDTVEAVARAVGIGQVAADLLPEDKVVEVRRLNRLGRRVLMVGDGTNDAPALASAAVGLALGAHGGGIIAEAADVVLLVDDLGRVPEAVAIGRRTMHIARQSIVVGLGLSGLAMTVAALGYIPPTAGALLQEAIDVAVILNALRAGVPARLKTPSERPQTRFMLAPLPSPVPHTEDQG